MSAPAEMVFAAATAMATPTPCERATRRRAVAPLTAEQRAAKKAERKRQRKARKASRR